MSNPSKRKGYAAEAAVVAYLRTHGVPHAERRLAGSPKDRGDLAGIPGIVWEVKDHKTPSLGAWVDEAETERQNDNAAYGVVIHKRRGKSDAGAWFATVPVAAFVQLLTEAGYIKETS